jgi:hypothetical protein
VSLGAWGNAGAGALSGAGAGGGNGGSAGGSSGTSGNAGASAACPRVGQPGPLNTPGSGVDATTTYTDWAWPEPFDSLEWDLQVEVEPTTGGNFWAQNFAFVGSAGGFLGLQSRGGFQADPPDGDVQTTNMVVFWISSNPLRAELGDVAYPDARTYLKADVGSNWWTIHVRYDFQSCRSYHLRVARHSLEPTGEIWYGAWVRDNVTNVETFLGRILVPAAWGQLAGKTSMWLSRIGYGDLDSCSDLEPVSGTFGLPTADRGAVRRGAPENRFQSPAACGASRFTTFSDGIRHEIGVQR